MIYSLSDIEAQLAPPIVEQGWQWFLEGGVSAPNVQRGGEIVTAVIRHGGARPLRVYVRTLGQAGTPNLRGECSCARRENCEHVVAVLLQALQDRGELPATPGSRRRQGRGKRLQQTAGRGDRYSQSLLYLLHAGENGEAAVQPVVARRRGDGGHNPGRAFDPARVHRGTPAGFLQPIDLDLLRELDGMPRMYESGCLLQGSGSDHLLRELLATGRLQLADEASGPGILCLTPLRVGGTRPLHLEWRCDDAGVQAVHSRTEPTSDLLLSLSTTWYVDGDSGECGPVAGDLPGEALGELLHWPMVAPEAVGEVSEILSNRYPGAPIPLPRQLEIEILPRSRPVPCLCLSTEETDWFGIAEKIDVARLHFDYGGVVLDPDGPDTRLREGRVLRVLRDRGAERAAVRKLERMGLTAEEAADSLYPGTRFTADTGPGFGAAEPWLDFQTDYLPGLRDQGWRISFQGFRHQLCEPSSWTCEIDRQSQEGWFSVELGVEVEGCRVNLLPILLLALQQIPHHLLERGELPTENLVVEFTGAGDETRLLKLPCERVLPLLQTLLEICSNVPAADSDRLPISRMQLVQLISLAPPAEEAANLQWLGDPGARQLLERLRNLDGIPRVSPPVGLVADLRPYQRTGLDWLQFLREFRFGGILADDMGLGKTLQALAHLLLEKEAGRADLPSLVIAPTSLMFNWAREAQRFAPGLKVLVLHGPGRKGHFGVISRHDLVLTTYPLLARDRRELLSQSYHLLILDEAQVAKNPRAQTSRVVRELDARHRVCLTGTPMENHLGELWSLFDVLLPGLLGDSRDFRRRFRTPIEQRGDELAAQRLRRRIRPFLLRRTKQEVISELPDKTEIVQRVALEGDQRELYETVRLAMHHRVREEIERQGLARSQLVVLDALLKLRQVCCDARLVKGERARAVDTSAKLDMLIQMLPEMVEEGRRILLFSQFTSMLGLIEAAVREAGIGYVKLTGRTRDRQSSVERFQQGSVPLFLISLKAGGVGLNLTAADTVIHYDPWWNPAVERQATDRAHRIGQRHVVFVYKLICAGTVEEKILAMQERKQALADGLHEPGSREDPRWCPEDLDELFAPLQDAAREVC